MLRFSLDMNTSTAMHLAPGILWLAILFSATTAMGRTFVIERDSGCMNALLMAPIDRGRIFLGKLVVNFALLVAFEAVLVPAFFLFFEVPEQTRTGALIGLLLAGNLGIAASGTLFALAALGTRARELVLPLLVVPLQVPLLLAAVESTAIVMGGGGLADIGRWAQVLVAFDVLFVTTGWLAFEFLAVD